MTLKPQEGDEQHQHLVKKEQRFVHSFFLSNEKQGAKKHFFVLNDVFRFLTEENKEEEKVEKEEQVEIVEEAIVEEEEKEIEVEKTLDGEVEVSLNETAHPAALTEEDEVEELPNHEEVV